MTNRSCPSRKRWATGQGRGHCQLNAKIETLVQEQEEQGLVGIFMYPWMFALRRGALCHGGQAALRDVRSVDHVRGISPFRPDGTTNVIGGWLLSLTFVSSL
jgi:hypothetical protein